MNVGRGMGMPPTAAALPPVALGLTVDDGLDDGTGDDWGGGGLGGALPLGRGDGDVDVGRRHAGRGADVVAADGVEEGGGGGATGVDADDSVDAVGGRAEVAGLLLEGVVVGGW